MPRGTKNIRKLARKPSRALLPALLLISIATPVRGEDPEYPLIQSLAYFPYTQNAPLTEKPFSLDLTFQYSNVFMFDSAAPVISDFESFTGAIGARIALTKRMTLETYFRFGSIKGGGLDKGVEAFHDAFGLPDNHRDRYPRDSVHYGYYDAFFYGEKRKFTSPAVVALHFNLYRRSGLSLATRVGVGIPVQGSAGLGGEKPFVSTGITATLQRGRTQINAAVYSAWYREPDWLRPYPLRPAILFSEIKAYWGSVITGFRARTSPFRTGDIAHAGYQVNLGCRIGPYLEFLIHEDLPRFDTTPDIGFSLNVKLI